MLHNLIIIGAGPAGYTAGIYAARANLSPLLFEGHAPGGQLMTTTDVENYPGFPQGLTGPELMQHFRVQAERFGTQLVSDFVSRVDFSVRPFQIWDSKGQLYEAHAVIVATGANAQWLGLEAEQTLQGRGVSACATCDGFFFRNKRVMVVGGGDTALEEALFLSNMASHVTVVHRRGELRASRVMQQRALENPKISFVWNTVLTDILDPEQGRVTAARLQRVDSSETWDQEVDGIFIAIGHRPATDLFKDQLELDQKGYILTHRGTFTSVEGVFAAGDVQDSIYRQAITSAGSGCMAAIDAERWLAGLTQEPSGHEMVSH